MIPLSTRMRPDDLSGFVGQQHFMYKGSLLYNAIENGSFESAIFFGPSGSGKTTLARIVAKKLDAGFVEINASQTGIKDLKALIDRTRDKFYGLQKESTFVYVDEIHRWNKLQQDTLLNALEEGILRFIGSTTENPYFSINNAILSRVRLIYEFRRLSDDDILTLLERTLKDRERGFGALEVSYDEKALSALASISNGDARVALDALGFIIDNMDDDRTIDLSIVEEATQRKATFYNRRDDKYDLYSALQKSIRGSDPDAAVHYLARLIEGGEDEMTIARRILVIASEDVGMAYPQAVSVVVSCVEAAKMVGLPEARINFAHAVILLASSPKSNSAAVAIDEALGDLSSGRYDEVPDHLRDSHYKGAEKRGFGIGYKYPHDYGGYVEQQYLPDNLVGANYYRPTENGSEAQFKKYLERIGKK
ncbi:MAG: replication-associated recombination protein A [Firmicutes bacterium]|nr:replication-associated recombination protein A [Bacillota bacterium]